MSKVDERRRATLIVDHLDRVLPPQVPDDVRLEWRALKELWLRLDELPSIEPSADAAARFKQFLATQDRGDQTSWLLRPILGPALGLLAASAIVGAVLLWDWNDPGPALSPLEQRVQQQLAHPGATERLTAALIAARLSELSEPTVAELARRLEQDTDFNVRLAALSALRKHDSQGTLGRLVVQTLADTRSPLLQFELVSVVADLGLVEALPVLRELLDSANLEDVTRRRIRSAIDALT